MFGRNFAFSFTSHMCMTYPPIEIDMTEEVRGKGREIALKLLNSGVMFLRVLSENIEPIYS